VEETQSSVLHYHPVHQKVIFSILFDSNLNFVFVHIVPEGAKHKSKEEEKTHKKDAIQAVKSAPAEKKPVESKSADKKKKKGK
jgi:hypothetical protein